MNYFLSPTFTPWYFSKGLGWFNPWGVLNCPSIQNLLASNQTHASAHFPRFDYEIEIFYSASWMALLFPPKQSKSDF